MNEYDSTKMVDVLRDSHGLELTDEPAEADVLLLNTCSVREKAAEKVFSQLGRWKNWKAKKPNLIIGVGGCVASQEGASITQRAPYVDLVFGPQTLHRLPAMLEEVRAKGIAVVDVSFPAIEKFDNLPPPRKEGVSAFVSVMEGCSKYCSFCVVPYTRGEEISRPLDDVVAEVVGLARQGVSEITLLGQNVNGYRGATHDGKLADLERERWDQVIAINLSGVFLSCRAARSWVQDGGRIVVLGSLAGRTGGILTGAAYAASKPLVAEPGSVWSYSSGTSNILSGVIRWTVGGYLQEYYDFTQKRLFLPLGIP